MTSHLRPPQSTTCILIVDDEPINLATMEGFLSADGYDLHFATNGREACDKARELHPDLILLDVMLPEIDGFGVCRLIRQDPVIGRIPILIVTALNDQQSRLEGLRAGADDFITKPCSRDEVRARVRTIASLNRVRAIAEQRERFEQLYELSPAAIVLTDDAGVVLAANRQAEVSFGGCADRTLVGRRICSCFGMAEIVAGAVGAALRQQPLAPQELRRMEKGSEQVLSLRCAPVPDGDRMLAMLVFDDITTEVKAREALEKMNGELEDLVRARTRQLEDANTLLLSYANFVSHDLRSPLTVMKGYLDLLREETVEMPPEARSMIAKAHHASYRMAEMIQNILQLAHEAHEHDAACLPPLDPTPVLNHLLSHIREIAPNPRTKYTIHPLPEVGVSGALLDRVFFNLLANAVKFAADQPVPHVEVGSVPHEDGVVLFVRDNGIGFDARDTDKLFLEFTRLDTARKTDGLGLGLSLVARLLQANKGRIWAESRVGGGATFYVLLPRPSAAAVQAN